MPSEPSVDAAVRAEEWPDTYAEAQQRIETAKVRYASIVRRTHTLDLLGLAQLISLELAQRREAQKRIDEYRPVGIGNR